MGCVCGPHWGVKDRKISGTCRTAKPIWPHDELKAIDPVSKNMCRKYVKKIPNAHLRALPHAKFTHSHPCVPKHTLANT